MEFLNVFASVDKDHDMIIYEQDLDNYAAEMNYQKAFTTKWLRLFDNDKDGRITFSEFCETLGLDEKIYEEKLKEIRKKQQQTSQKKPPARRPQKEVDEEQIKPQAARKIRTAAPPSRPEEVVVEEKKKDQYYVEITDGPSQSGDISVEYSELEQQQLEKVKAAIVDGQRAASDKQLTTAEFDRHVMRSLEKSLGKGWSSQTNPSIGREEVQYQDGCMAVLRVASGQRVMVWKSQESAGCCCCC